MKDYPLETMINDLQNLVKILESADEDEDLDENMLPKWYSESCDSYDECCKSMQYFLDKLIELKDLRKKNSNQNQRGLYLL